MFPRKMIHHSQAVFCGEVNEEDVFTPKTCSINNLYWWLCPPPIEWKNKAQSKVLDELFFWKNRLFCSFKNLQNRAEVIDLVQNLSKSGLSSRFFGNLKIFTQIWEAGFNTTLSVEISFIFVCSVWYLVISLVWMTTVQISGAGTSTKISQERRFIVRKQDNLSGAATVAAAVATCRRGPQPRPCARPALPISFQNG